MEKVTDELIEKFLSGNCTKEEATDVLAYLQQNPEGDYLEKEYGRTDGSTPLPEGYSESMLGAIVERTAGTSVERSSGRKGLLVQPVWKWAAAAAFLTLGSWFVFKYTGQFSESRQIASHTDKTPGPSSVWITNKNEGSRKISLLLPDSSRIILSSGSYIRYRQDFGHYDKREVEMQGDAFFSVAKKKNMPFTVYSDGIRTTALGTAFEVKDDSGSDKISVRLYTGKVVVSLATEGNSVRNATGMMVPRARAAGAAAAQKGYFLSPWEELVFEKRSRQVVVNGFDGRGRKGWKPLRGTAESLSNWYMFSDQNLGVVFDQLSAIYNVEIQYSKGEVSKMYFIGKLEPGDSLDKIIRDIASLNHLAVTMHNGRYFIGTEK